MINKRTVSCSDIRTEDFKHILFAITYRFLSSALSLKNYDGAELKCSIDGRPYKILFVMEKQLRKRKHGK